MSVEGDGIIIDLGNLPKVRTVQLSSFTFEKFRQMCMLSGCDYLPSIKGMGLIKAHRALRKYSDAYQVSVYFVYLSMLEFIVFIGLNSVHYISKRIYIFLYIQYSIYTLCQAYSYPFLKTWKNLKSF